LTLLLSACAPPDGVPVPGHPDAVKTAAVERALRRAYDGAPPVIPHEPLGAACIACHNRDGVAVPDLGFAPPSPHEETRGMSAISRCRQCHVFRTTEEVFVANELDGLAQDLRHGGRLHDLAPPVIPHKVFMRENCQACHAGPAAREEIRTTHPERTRCRQCHLEQQTAEVFKGSGSTGP
jgi:cytochrome c-type protein NapB